MNLYPAIDLRGGRCVRLYQGDYDRETHYGDDPVSQARAFAEAGAQWLHVVDLDAARSGDPLNRPVIGAICEAIDIPVQCGGGVRSRDAAAALADVGVERVVIGTAAVEQPSLVGEVAARQSVAVGLDARGRELATHGWEQSTGDDLLEAARRFSDVGASALVVTEIGRDGTLEGPAVDQLSEVLAAAEVAVIASGGVGTLDDIASLGRLAVEGRTLEGVIVGRALYEQKFDVTDALAAVGGATP